MKQILIIIATTLLFACCNSSHERKIMKQVESVVYSAPDSAQHLLQQVSYQELKSDKDKAYYALLKSISTYKLYQKQSIDNINYALSYYKNNNDTHHLQMAYFYHGAINEDNNGKLSDYMRDYKEAEALITNTNNQILQSYIYNALIRLCFLHNDNVLGLEYSDKSIMLAKGMNDLETISGAYLNKAIFNRRMEEIDSAKFYYKESLKYISYVKDSTEIANTYNNIALFYENQSDTKKEKIYHDLAARYAPNDSSYYSICNKLYKIKSFHEVLSQVQALSPSTLAEQLNLYITLSQIADRYNEYLKAYQYGEKADSIQELINSDKNKPIIRKIQDEYSRKEFIESKHSTFTHALIIIAVLITMSIISIYYIRKYYTKQNKTLQNDTENLLKRVNILSFSLSNNQEKNEEYSNIITSQENAILSVSKELEALKQQNKKQRKESKRYIDQLINGLDITIKLIQGETIKIMEKKDRADFICVHSITDQRLRMCLEENDMTIQEKVFFILAQLGLNRKQIQQDLCLSDDAFRKVKSRLIIKLSTDDNIKNNCDILKHL